MGVDLGERFEAAVQMAHELHRTQRLNATEPAYLAHLLAVTSLVLDAGGDEDAAIAAILHDAAEDQEEDSALAVITEAFGANVGAIVDACSETVEYPKRPAIERKGRYIERLDNDDTTSDVLLVTMADKLHGLRTILADYRAVGPALWDRFDLGPTDQLWYYRSLAEVYRRRVGGPMSLEIDELLVELAGALATPSDLTWATLAVLPEGGYVGLGDPAAVNAPTTAWPSREGRIQVVADSGLGLIGGCAETDGRPVEIGVSGYRIVAVRIGFVTDLDERHKAGNGTWLDLGQFACNQVAAIDLRTEKVPADHVEIPLPAGQYKASAFRDDHGDALGLLLRATRSAW
jgi:hypothetical protein